MWALLLVTLPLVIGDCRLDMAIVTAVPPATAHVITISECGAIKCWERWIETDGQRIGHARACASSGPPGGAFEVLPPPERTP